MSTARRRLKSPWSLSGTIRPPTMITLNNIMGMNGWLTSFLFHVNRTFHFMRLGYCRLWPWNSKVKVMDVIKGQSHIVSPVSYWLASFSFHINQTNNSWDTAISKFDLEISKVKVMSEAKRSRSHIAPSIQPMHFLLISHQSDNHSWDMTKIVFDLEETHPKFLNTICQNNNFRQNFSKI